jgi:hypothetical protein
MAGSSPLYRFSEMQRMSAMVVDARTFNNCLGFERRLWQLETVGFVDDSKTSVSGGKLIGRQAKLEVNRDVG